MIHQGDLFDVLPTLEADSIDACVTDPPYELGFMAKHWDSSGVAYKPETWAAVLRVLKPGAHLLAFGGTRTYHRMACAIEDAGFEIRDCLSWLYGQGFPKSLDVSKAMDKAAGADRPVVGFSQQQQQRTPAIGTNAYGDYKGQTGDITAPATHLAKQWAGWGTALKPGWEPIVLARKAFKGTVAQTVARYGTGAINVDACRIGTSPEDAADMERCNTAGSGRRKERATFPLQAGSGAGALDCSQGRWPANVLLDDEAARLLDEQTGEMVDGVAVGGKHSASGSNAIYMRMPKREGADNVGFGGRGGASRFFYVAKPSREERDYGCHDLAPRSGGEATDRQDGSAGVNSPRAGAGRTGGARNIHPTVKPVELMRWLVRLVTPPNGLVLDPFTGSGTTGMACRYEQRRFIGIEREAEYVAIAERRIAAVAPLFGEATA